MNDSAFPPSRRLRARLAASLFVCLAITIPAASFHAHLGGQFYKNCPICGFSIISGELPTLAVAPVVDLPSAVLAPTVAGPLRDGLCGSCQFTCGPPAP